MPLSKRYKLWEQDLGDEVYIGIDPGASGGIAILHQTTVLTYQITKSTTDLVDWLEQNTKSEKRFAVIEWINPSYFGSAKGSNAKLYGNYMLIQGVLTTLRIPFETVKPTKWQRDMDIPPKGKSERRTNFKNRIKGRAQELFPGVRIVLATSDALVIAEYCRRKRTGTL